MAKNYTADEYWFWEPKELLLGEVISLKKRKATEFSSNVWHITSDIWPRHVNQDLGYPLYCDVSVRKGDFSTCKAYRSSYDLVVTVQRTWAAMTLAWFLSCVEWIPASGPGKSAKETKGKNCTVAYLQHLINLQHLSRASGLRTADHASDSMKLCKWHFHLDYRKELGIIRSNLAGKWGKKTIVWCA